LPHSPISRTHQLAVSCLLPCSYPSTALAVDDEGQVQVHAIYEPPQQGSADSLSLERGTEEEALADFIAVRLG
jgi:hypothetical protein